MAPAPLDPEAAAALAEREGMRVRLFRGRFWQCLPNRRFFYPVGRIERLHPDEIARPAVLASGYRALVSDRASANGITLNTIVEDLPSYGPDRVAKDQRRMVRRSLKRNEYELVTDLDSFLAQAWRVGCEARAHTGQYMPASPQAFARGYRDRMETGHYWLLAGSRGGQLGGFLAARAIGEAVYYDQICLSHAGREWGVGVGLYWLTLLAHSRQPSLRRAWLGSWSPYYQRIASFKASFGGYPTPTPTISWVSPLVREIVRRRNPLMFANLGQRGDLDRVDPGAAPTRS